MKNLDLCNHKKEKNNSDKKHYTKINLSHTT